MSDSPSYRCVWCLRHEQEGVTFTSESHVLPNAVGNTEWTLPPGVVCDPCNQYFGQKIEPGLLDDPLFHVRAVALGAVDPDDMNAFRNKIFDAQHPSTNTVNRHLHLDVKRQGQTLDLDVQYAIRGQMERSYTTKQLAALSRSIHKIGFEALVYSSISKKDADDPIDPYSPLFDEVRKWAREGQPHGKVRPMIRNLGNEISTNYSYGVWRFGEHVGVQLSLFGDWYGVSLTSTTSEAKDHVWKWANGTHQHHLWILGESLHRPTG